MPQPVMFRREDRIAYWEKVAAEAPYRASMKVNADWDTDLPSPDLIDAWRTTPARRLLLAFQSAEVRDFFVEGHRVNGAHADPDWANTAIRPEPKVKARPAAIALDDAVVAMHAAERAVRAADAWVERAFLDDAMRLLAEGKMEEAVAVVASIHGSVMKTIGVSRLMDGGWDRDAIPFDRTAPAPLTSERALALRAVLVAKRDAKAAQEVVQRIVEKPFAALVKAKDLDGAEALIDRLRPSMMAINLNCALYTLQQERKAAAQAVPKPDACDDDTPAPGF